MTADRQGPDGRARGAQDSGASAAADQASGGHERLVQAAYELFSRNGIQAVGVDADIARAGTAKMTLYRNFPSKDELILEFLRRRSGRGGRRWRPGISWWSVLCLHAIDGQEPAVPAGCRRRAGWAAAMAIRMSENSSRCRVM